MQPSPDAPGNGNTQLVSVACPSASRCFAVGNWQSGSSENANTVIERYNGTAWKLQSSPTITGTTWDLLYGVSCPSASHCWATGQAGGFPFGQVLIEQWDGASWSVQAAPHPSSAEQSVILGIDCVAITSCLTVGEAGDIGGPTATLVESGP
jgi:hypothetical protein